MKSEKKAPEQQNQEVDSGTLKSMVFSLFLVGLSVLFVFGFHKFLQVRTYNNLKNKNSDEILTVDNTFDSKYILVRNAEKKDLFITETPGEVKEDSRKVSDGQIYSVEKKGIYESKVYYRLSDQTYIEASTWQIQEISEYIPLEGYIAITYISSSGVHLRSWIDYHDEANVVGTVFVGDKVDVTAMLVTSEGVSAFLTSEGYFITTDSSYFSDYTNLKDKMESDTGAEMDSTWAEENSTEIP